MRYLRTIYMALAFATVVAGSANAQQHLISDTGGTVTTTQTGSTGVSITAASGYPDVSITTGNTASSSAFHIFNSGNVELLHVQADGKVGIGTPNPARALDIFGRGSNVSAGILSGDPTQYAAYSLGRAAAEGLLAVAAGPGQFDTFAVAGDMVFRSTTGSVILNALNHTGGISFNTGDDNDGGDSPRMSILHSGKVGIGTTAPTALLQVSAYGSTSPAQFKDMILVNGLPGVLLDMTANSEIHIANIQIGTATRPVIQTTATGQSLYLNADFDNNVVIGSSTHAGSGLQVASTGTSTFAGPVNVSGTLTATTVYADYQDVAEWVPAAGSMPAGTVVVISGDTNNTVTASSHAYDTGVAGVVSPKPGLLLGAAGASKAKIATTGRVRVRVDASKYPIRMGDLLVTSDKPGMAMKSEPLDLGGVKIHRPGTLIGKALEPLPSGEGDILVLLSLQ